MKHELRYHLLTSSVIFVLVSIFLVIFKVASIKLFYLFLGISIGSFILDIDHFIFWFFLKPNLEESRLARATIKNHDFKSIYRLLKASHHTHYNLIFHHYFFQVGLNLISLFIFISSSNIFCLSFLLSINLHLLTDEIRDYLRNPKFLQNWLFAREERQLSIKSLKNYLIIFNILFFIFLFLLVKSKT